jgi:adenylyltransferase/sulfurtransferase
MTSEDRERYSRQILFHGIGEGGQERLLGAHAAIAGCGALGTFHAGALARAGVGRITIVDRDSVEPSNLQRQWLFDEDDAAEGLPKAVAAERRLTRVNSGVTVRGVVADLRPENIGELLEGADAVLDGLDNFESRFLLNDYAVSTNTPWIHGAAVGSYGIVMPVIPGRTACLRCVYPKPPGGAQPTCETAGVLNAITAAVASLQVAAALKLLSGHADAVEPRITTMDFWSGGIRQIEQPPRDPDCPACGKGEFPYLEGECHAPVSLCGRNAVQIHDRRGALDLAALRKRLSSFGEVRANEFALRFFAKGYEMTIFPDGRAIVKGTTDSALARSLYARYIGN